MIKIDREYVERLLTETVESLEFKQKYNREYPEQANRMKEHFLDGRRELLEELLKVFDL